MILVIRQNEFDWFVEDLERGLVITVTEYEEWPLLNNVHIHVRLRTTVSKFFSKGITGLAVPQPSIII